ncbi:MAG: YidC/Oxa1 family membrane protein insertase, partial [Candidatus Jacksonbacteria bacterium]
NLFNTFLYVPILNLLILIYNILPLKDMGIAIILLTVILKLVLWPLSKQQIEAQKKMKELQPKIAEINKKYKGDAQKRGSETMRLYKENKANPASSCLPILVQLPILWAVFKVFQNGFKPEALDKLYGFIGKPEIIDKFFLNIHYFDLSQPNILLTVITAAVQFWQTKMLSTAKPAVDSPGAKDEGMQAVLNKQMIYLMPAITLFIGLKLPSGLMLYWLVSTLLMGVQQWWQFRENSNLKTQISTCLIGSPPKRRKPQLKT